jgi:hypothetical protein
MPDWFWIGLKWTAIAVALAPIVIGIGWGIVEGSVLPRLIPRDEIERLAEDIIGRYPADPEEAAFIEEHAAWFRSESFEQGKWRRVGKAIRRRLIASQAPPA